jgi:hypothetical protein
METQSKAAPAGMKPEIAGIALVESAKQMVTHTSTASTCDDVFLLYS